MKRKIIITLILVLSITSNFVGCKNKNDVTKDSNTTIDNSKIYTKPGEYPITKEKITLKFYVPQVPVVSDFNDNDFTRHMEELTNIHIEWESSPDRNKINLMLATGDFPDVFYGSNISKQMEQMYGVEQNSFMPLDYLIEKNANNFKEVLKESEGLREIIKATDGKIYSLPSWNDVYHVKYPIKAWINKAWLDKLGLSMPTTTEEFYNVLMAFKLRDPNGNGKQDEIPYAGATDGWFTRVDNFIMNSFILDDAGGLGLVVKDGKVDTIVNKPEYKEGLKYLNRLYREGLLYQGSFTQKTSQLKQLAMDKNAELLGAFASGASVNAIDLATSKDRYKNYVALAPLKGPNGLQQTTYYKYPSAQTGSFVITKSCKYPEAAIRWADYLYSFEGAMRHHVGRPGKEWRKASEGEVGFTGGPAVYKHLVPYSTEAQNYMHSYVGIRYNPNKWREGMVADPNVDLYSPEGMEKMLYLETLNKYAPYEQKNMDVVPPLRLLTNEEQELSTIVVEITNQIDQAKIKFILGEINIDSEWDKYVKGLENVGIKKVLEVYNKAYERQYNK